MPIIANHHRPAHPFPSDPEYSPQQAWADDTYVQWGSHGVVLSENSYETAFFEAFPKKGSFIRGEGSDIAAAEADAFAQWQRESACDHVWGRRSYTNGGGKCSKCKGWKSGAFRPIVRLGDWRRPFEEWELSSIISGWLRGTPTAARNPDEMQRSRRREWLRARHHGIDLPPIPPEPMSKAQFMGREDDPFRDACQQAVGLWLERSLCNLDIEARDRVRSRLSLD